jgi:hypothetical protein
MWNKAVTITFYVISGLVACFNTAENQNGLLVNVVKVAAARRPYPARDLL